MKRTLMPWFLCLLATVAGAQPDPAWTLAWSDEFNQPNGSLPDSSKWTYDTGAGGWGNNERQYYTTRTNNARIENGCLVIEARQESYSGASYTSARMKTQNRASWALGRVEARIKIPRSQGIWPAFWMLGTNIPSAGWPACGEIDIMENIGAEPTIIHGTIHGPGYSGGGSIGAAYSLPGNPAFADDFHVYAMEWTTNQIKWFVDGVQYFSVNPASLPAGSSWGFTQPHFILLNVAVGGNWPGYPDGTTVLPQRMTVDYVRVYAPSGAGCSTNMLANGGFESGTLAKWSSYGSGGNTLVGRITNLRVRSGTNVFKVYGQFNGQENYSGVIQDVPIAPGQAVSAGGWALTPSGDSIAGANSAWIEVAFRNASSANLALYRSAAINSSAPVGGWLYLGVTNQLDPVSYAMLGAVTNLVAPPGAVSARFQIVFRQPAGAAGSVLFDDLRLAPVGQGDTQVPARGINTGAAFKLSFPTYLGVNYAVRYKTNPSDPNWLPLTNIVGDGTVVTLSEPANAPQRFYRVCLPCE